MNDEVIEIDATRFTAKRRGRGACDFWTVFTDVVEAHKLKSTKCKHCKQVMNYHKKSENTIRHLNNHCPPFKKFMNGKELSERAS